MRYHIGATGSRWASLAVVAEKPGRDEFARLLQRGSSEPLIGSSGGAVDRHLLKAGFRREEVYLTNAVRHFDTIGNPSDEDIKRDQAELFKELCSLPNLNCIIALGNAALLSLSNFHYDSVMKRRGSILQTVFGRKMVPSFHPAFYFRGEWRYQSVVDFDFQRAAQQSRSRDIVPPEIYCHIAPTFSEAMDWLRFLTGWEEIAFDIELFRGRYISCIAFCPDGKNAFCIPLAHGNRVPYWNLEQEMQVWLAIAKLLSLRKTFYTHNGPFDCWHLWRHGISTPHMSAGFDSMLAHKLLAPDLPHDLAFVNSIYTEIPYYKDESGRWDTEIKVPDDQFWGYNCKDAIATWLCAKAIQEDMIEYNMLEYYRTTVQPQWDPYMDMRQKGWRINTTLLADIKQKLIAEVNELQDTLKAGLGWVPNSRSPIEMAKMFQELGVKPYTTPTGRVSMKEEHISEYARSTSGEARQYLLTQQEITRRRTLLSTFTELALDDKEHYHPSYNINHARTGRSSGEGSEDGGPQLQNIPKRMRKIFIADDSESEIITADLKQAEAMIVAWDSQDPQLISAFEKGKDVHRVRGCRIYRNWLSSDLPPDELMATIRLVCDRCSQFGETECSHSERQIAKISGHALSYKMGVQKLCKTLARADIFIAYSEGERIKKAVVSTWIEEWQNRVEWELKQSPVLTGPLGRVREFYGLLDEDMIRAALSWKAQHVVGDVTNRAMIFLYRTLPKGSRLLTQTHDSISVTAKKAQREEVSSLIDKAFNQIIYYHERPLVIPIDKTYKETW